MQAKPEQLNSIYNHNFRNFKNKKSVETNETINETLPNIAQQNGHHNIKNNQVRSQLNQTKSQILLMEAKLKNLKNLKEKFELRHEHNQTKIQFTNGVKERIRNESEYKDKINREREESLQKLKKETQELRESLVNNRKNAENVLYMAKSNEAEMQRRRRRHHEYLVNKLRQLDMVQKNRKVEKIKQHHQSSSSRIQEFHESRINFSRDNYHKKVLTTMKEKERAHNLLRKLKEQEERLLNDVRSSEKTMLTSLYSLSTLNPQKKKKRINSDRHFKHDNSSESYDNQQFQK